MGLTVLLNDPFYEGAAVAASDVPYRLPVSIGDHAYLIEVPMYRRGVVDQLRQPTDQGSEPGEQSFNTQGLWKRSQSDYSLGAGQDFLDAEDSSRRRFRASKGVNPWTKHQLSLHHDTELKRASASSNLMLLSAYEYLFQAAGTAVVYTSDPTPASPTFTTVTGLAGTSIADMTTDGRHVYVADGTNVKRVTIGVAAAAAFSAYTADRVDYCNGRLIASDGGTLVELDSAGASTTLKTLTFTGAFNGAVGAPNGIYAWATPVGFGTRSEVYYLGVDEATGGLSTAVLVNGGWPEGETINDMVYYGGVMVLATSRGIRLAAIDAGGGLSIGPVITEPGPVQTLFGFGEYVWFGWDYDDTSVGLGRLDLAHWTSEMVPAFASDLMATVGSGGTQDIAWHMGKMYFTVSGSGLWGENDDLVSVGHLYSGWVRYGSFERKILSSIDVRTTPLAGVVEMHVHLEDGSHVDVAAHDEAGSLSPSSARNIDGVSGEAAEIHLELQRDGSDATAGPTLRHWTLRALPAPSVIEEITLPIILADDVTNDRGIQVAYDTLAEYQYLVGLVESKEPVRYQEGSSSYRVYVSKVEMVPNEWSDHSRFFNGILAVRLITITPNG